jgi:hypothetical protein
MLHVARDASQQNVSANGRYGSTAVLTTPDCDFRSTPNSGHHQTGPTGPFSARRRHRFGHQQGLMNCIRCGHLLDERSKSNDDFGCSLTVASDKIEHLLDFFQIWRLSAQPV